MLYISENCVVNFFFSFPPQKSENFKIWKAVCKLRKNYAYNNLRLCTRHFSRDDLIFGCERVILKQGAVPKINVPNSEALFASQRDEPKTETSKYLSPNCEGKCKIYSKYE